jgi:hypothetical protein
METFDQVTASEGAEEEERRARHYSTGRLTLAQAELVDRWRVRLLADRPLQGQRPVGAALRLLGIDDRPRASCSDVIAAAVAELLAQAPPTGLEAARYADASWQAQRRAGRGQGAAKGAPLHQPVSFYLPAELADVYDELRARARARVLSEHDEVRAEARRRYPDARKQAYERRAWTLGELAERGVPLRVALVPGGVPARMAIDRWARRSADRAARAGVEWAAEVHEQPHRGRKDMYRLGDRRSVGEG